MSGLGILTGLNAKANLLFDVKRVNETILHGARRQVRPSKMEAHPAEATHDALVSSLKRLKLARTG